VALKLGVLQQQLTGPSPQAASSRSIS